MNVEENCIPIGSRKDRKQWSSWNWSHLLKWCKDFKSQQELQKYWLSNETFMDVFRHRCSRFEEIPTDFFIGTNSAKLQNLIQITNNHSQLPLSRSQIGVAFRGKHADPLSDRRSLTEKSLSTSNSIRISNIQPHEQDYYRTAESSCS